MGMETRSTATEPIFYMIRVPEWKESECDSGEMGGVLLIIWITGVRSPVYTYSWYRSWSIVRSLDCDNER